MVTLALGIGANVAPFSAVIDLALPGSLADLPYVLPASDCMV
jgi:hypothetical protein